MKISKAQWDRYIKLTSALKGTARKKMDAYIAQNGISDMDAVIDYAYGLATKYGEGTSAIAAEMYDGIARAQGAKVPSAEPAPTASYKDTAKAVTYAKGRGQSLIPGAVETLVKQAGADTMLRNAARDGAEFAWVPHGSETCPMCLTIASNGWRRASRKTMKGDHAEHIHSSCDCEFAIRFDGKSSVEGYDPDALREKYDNAEGSTWKDKVNFMRREQYKANGDKIRAQKRVAYAKQQLRKIGAPSNEELRDRARQMKEIEGNWGIIANRIASGEYSLKYKHQKYLQHQKDTVQYKQTVEQRGREQSYLTISEEEAQAYACKYAGLGNTGADAVDKVLNHEFIDADKIIGKYFEKGEWHETRRMKIFHSKKGIHIVPVKSK